MVGWFKEAKNVKGMKLKDRWIMLQEGRAKRKREELN